MFNDYPNWTSRWFTMTLYVIHWQFYQTLQYPFCGRHELSVSCLPQRCARQPINYLDFVTLSRQSAGHICYCSAVFAISLSSWTLKLEGTLFALFQSLWLRSLSTSTSLEPVSSQWLEKINWLGFGLVSDGKDQNHFHFGVQHRILFKTNSKDKIFITPHFFYKANSLNMEMLYESIKGDPRWTWWKVLESWMLSASSFYLKICSCFNHVLCLPGPHGFAPPNYFYCSLY